MPNIPLCEPVELAPGLAAIVRRVDLATDSSGSARLPHFHAVAEIVLFGEVSGSYECEGRSFALSPGAVVYAPPMACHDFALSAGRKDWILIQFDPYLAAGAPTPMPAEPLCVTPDAAMRKRLWMLAEWLAESLAAPRRAAIVEQQLLMLMSAVSELAETAAPASGAPSRIDQFRPLLRRLHATPAASVDLSTAAALCNLSPTYFSRRFKAQFGCGLPDYQLALRLHIAARRLATTSEPVSLIAYALGFRSHAHFTARFRARFGLAPRDFRQNGAALPR